MAGNILVLRANSAGATTSADHLTLGVDTNARKYSVDIAGPVLYDAVRQVLPFANASGDTSLTFSGRASDLTAVVQISGGVSARKLIVPVADRVTDDICEIRVNTGVVSGVTVDIVNATSGGASLIGGALTVDGSGNDNLWIRLRFNGTAWERLALVYPSF